MNVADAPSRLGRFWGLVDARHIDLIRRWVRGSRVLDLGCGYGSFTGTLNSEHEFDCVGIDADSNAIAVARRLYPQGEFIAADAESLPLDTGSCDTIVLRDALHHLVNEADWERVSAEIARVSAPAGRLIAFDPNVHTLLRAARKLARHDDEECDFESALRLASELGFPPIHAGFHTYFALPVSGGFVGPELVPDWPGFQQALLRIEDLLDGWVGARPASRKLAWRYLIVGDRGA